MTPRYEPHDIEAKWQRVWEDERAFNVPNPVPGEPTAENHWYQLEMLPYPSGPSLHMGHVLNYTMGDVQTHVRRRSGWHVVRPMGWDAFGLPAENAAIKEGRHPRVTIEANIETMRAQMKRLGWAIDWEREVAAHQPTFYRWTQWLFQQFVAHELCYRSEGPVNWCPNDQTVIANEYVVDGHCERCGAEVELRNMTQWFMRTTAYADELLEYPGRRLAGEDEGDPAQLDRPLGGRRDPVPRRGDGRRHRGLHDARRHALRRDVLRPRAGASVRRRARERRGEGVRAPRRRAPGRGALGRDREDRRLHGPPRGQPGQRRAAADLGRRLRPDGLRHGRDHGRPRARRARRRVRRDVRAAVVDRDRRGRQARQLRPLRRHAGGRGRRRRSSASSRRRAAARRR